jgi:hypothetical protein
MDEENYAAHDMEGLDPLFVHVTAPVTMQEGYTFEAVLADGTPFSCQVVSIDFLTIICLVLPPIKILTIIFNIHFSLKAAFLKARHFGFLCHNILKPTEFSPPQGGGRMDYLIVVLLGRVTRIYCVHSFVVKSRRLRL